MGTTYPDDAKTARRVAGGGAGSGQRVVLVSECSGERKRLLRFVGAGAPASGAALFLGSRARFNERVRRAFEVYGTRRVRSINTWCGEREIVRPCKVERYRSRAEGPWDSIPSRSAPQSDRRRQWAVTVSRATSRLGVPAGRTCEKKLDNFSGDGGTEVTPVSGHEAEYGLGGA